MTEIRPEPEVLVRRSSIVGEGAIWDSEKKLFYWVDILDQKLFVYNPETKENREIDTCQAVGTVVPREKGGLAIALHNGFAWIDLDTEKITPLGDPERSKPENRFNDGKCDPAGRFWAGTMEFGGEPNRGALYCMELDHSVSEKVSPATISNGIAWSLDHRTMYYADTGLNTVRAYDYDVDSGDISRERVVIECEAPGHFDGMTIDEEGMLWIAVFQGWAVRRYNPDTAELLLTVNLPVSQVTSCALGGDDLNELYITSASHGFDEQQWKDQPLTGSLLRVPVDVRGVPAFSFQG